MTQYSKRMVIIHWLTLALLVVAWLLGDDLAGATDESAATLAGYMVHALVGGTILLLTVTLLFFRSVDGIPPLLNDKPLFQILAKGVHYGLYALLLLLPASGIMTIVTSSVGKALLAGDANLLPKADGFEHVFAHEVHEVLVTVLIVLVAVHLLGAIKHQFIMKDGLIRRMSLRRSD